MSMLFDSIKIGRLTCPNRIWMAPLTRGRGTRDHVPTDLMATYYAQRASAGLIITEATGITLEGSGWPYAGGLWGAEHVKQWKKVTDALHLADRTARADAERAVFDKQLVQSETGIGNGHVTSIAEPTELVA
jgi:2,4-dienoyl-CoA reductase-like NADH-dependent reductase (Old Yellow Enzyme family)